MKETLLIILLSITLIGYAQDNPIIFGQEMSKSLVDDNNNEYSIVQPNAYEVYGIDVGDTIYYNDLVTMDLNGYPMDMTYKFIKIEERKYKIVAVIEE